MTRARGDRVARISASIAGGIVLSAVLACHHVTFVLPGFRLTLSYQSICLEQAAAIVVGVRARLAGIEEGDHCAPIGVLAIAWALIAVGVSALIYLASGVMRRRKRRQRLLGTLRAATIIVGVLWVVSPWLAFVLSLSMVGSVASANGSVIAILFPEQSYELSALVTWEIGLVDGSGGAFEWSRWECVPFGHRAGMVAFPAWAPLVIGTAACVALRVCRPRLPPGHCKRCGYNLSGAVSDRCPECGEAFAA